MFQLHAALLWTISDFPAYANLSGWSTKGEYACPCCNVKTQSYWLKHGRKYSYISHRYVLSNTSSVAPFISKHLEVIKSKMPRASDHQIQSEHFETFYTWFKDHVQTLRRTSNITFTEEINRLADGPHIIIPTDRVSNEPFILSSQAEQVWYVPDPLEPDWQVVVKMSQRGLFDMNSNDDPQVEPYMTQHLEDNTVLRDEEIGWVREGIEGATIDVDEDG
ncbi:uncharacterized protein LOC114288527 [Camellia sinensis]|uniref:uncharacterized protein LOC114288527 n=1 Tax=Camellia sinensis TaxID=4442 RepID=UPI00103556AF|nr:uncharacterized protein LOC114288527 [Camellia sinensis]